MSGEAALNVGGARFQLAILSGQPVWTAAEAASVEAALKNNFGAAVAEISKRIDSRAPALQLLPMEPPAPTVPDAVTEPVHAGQPLPGGNARAKIHLAVRHPPTMQGFNLQLTVGASAARLELEALAIELARLLWPDFQPELPIRIS